MDEKTVFQCEQCKKIVKIGKGEENSLICCDKPMKKMSGLSTCENSGTAEQYRLFDEDDPCDDGVM